MNDNNNNHTGDSDNEYNKVNDNHNYNHGYNNTYDEGGWENRKKDNRQMKGVCDFVKLNYIYKTFLFSKWM